jgi:hypothetical protein
MITQLRNSTSITIDRTGNTFSVLMAGQPVGTFELLPVCFVDDINQALSLGLSVADKCYVANGHIFRADEPTDIQRAATQLVNDHLLSTAHWVMPNF